jgi:chromosome segregation ATPase
MTTPREKLYTEGSYLSAEQAKAELDEARRQCNEYEQANHQLLDDALKLECERDKAQAELRAIIAELRNYELNGSDAAKQIQGIYSDLELTFGQLRGECAKVARLREALEDERSRNCWCDFGHESKKCAMCVRVDTVLKETEL